MKSLIFIAIVFTGLMATGCTTTYLNLKENSTAEIGEKINNYEKDKNIGAEITLSIKNGEKISGELLSVRENSVTICTQYSAKERELARLKYPIYTFRNDEIKELTIEGRNYIWIGLGIGTAVGAGVGALIGNASDESSHQELVTVAFGVIGLLAGAIAGGVVGYLLSTDELILNEIPSDYNMSLLKPLARYPDEEPEYLRAIN